MITLAASEIVRINLAVSGRDVILRADGVTFPTRLDVYVVANASQPSNYLIS